MKSKYFLVIFILVAGFTWGWLSVSLIKNFVVNPVTEEDLIPAEMKPTDVGCDDCYYSVAGKVLFLPAWVISSGETFMYGGPNRVRTEAYVFSGIVGSLVFGVLMALVWGLGRFVPSKSE